jgi:putative tryptophan/tyrosine transport system substrate-binding protein
MSGMRRREFVALLGGAGLLCAAKARRARAQQPMPVVGFLGGRAPEEAADDAAAFRQGLSEMGYAIGRNVALEYRWSEGMMNVCPSWRPNWFSGTWPRSPR